MKRIFVVIILTLSVTALSENVRIVPSDCLTVDDRIRILAKLMSRTWFENDYFTESDFRHLALISFKGMGWAKDGAYYEKIMDVDTFSVIRIKENIHGSSEHLVKLNEHEFWKRVLFIDYVIKNKKYEVMHGAISLKKIDDWFDSYRLCFE